ncbi:MAG: PilZ domain-containing protein [Bdellovibrio sp.]|nr:PilZ domain-containing protein [Bdellovibrio sp.]
MSKWFLEFQGRVQGPFTNEALEMELRQRQDNEISKIMVWKRGLTDWMKATKWQPEITGDSTAISKNMLSEETNINYTQTAQHQKTNNAVEKTIADTLAESAFFRVQLNYVDQPLMTKPELLNYISKLTDISKLSIQNPKTKEWNEVFAYPDIVERLGLSRRKQPRVPILAQFNGHSNKHPSLGAKIVTISEGGMGFTEVFDLKIGDNVEGQIMSPQFFQPLNVKADVIYSGLDGYIGLKFTEINDEAKAVIIEYVKKFGKITQQGG